MGTSTGAVTDSAQVQVAGTMTISAAGSNITLDDDAADTDTYGTLVLTGANVIVVEDAASDLGLTSISGTLSLTSTGAVTDSAQVQVAGTTTISAAGNNITLDDDAADTDTYGTLVLTGVTVTVVEDAAM